ncbi:MAG: sodium/solute symporter [Pirellulales bacterium]|nr:sodium/solute symporter [Pirellulales bacterium]
MKDSKDYFLAGRSLTWWVIGLSIIGTNIGTNSYIGASGNAYSIGIAQANFEWIGAIPAMIICSLIFIPLYWKAGVYSIPEYLGLRYNQPVRLVAALIACIVAVFAIGVGMWALALTLETYIGWPIWLGILVSGTVVGFYSISGGLAAVAITDSLQVCIMFLCGLIIVNWGLEGLGGWDNFASQLTEEHPTHLQTYLPADHESYPWPGVILGLGLVLSPAYWIGSQAILQRSLGAKSQWDASASMMFAAFAKTLVPLLIVFPGILALVMKADIDYPDMALPWIIKNVLPAGISGLMFVAIIAALQSTIDSGINSTSLMITRDIRHVLLKNDSTENDLKIGRYLTLLILVIAMSIAPFIGELGGIFTFMQTVLSLFQGPMLALLLLGALSKRATPQAGLWTLITGVPVAGIFLLLGMNMLYVAFVTFCYSMIVLWLVSGVTKGLAEDQLDRLTYLTWRR